MTIPFEAKNQGDLATNKTFRKLYLRRQVADPYMTAVSEPDESLDISADICPMTFVRTRLALDRLAPGQTLLVLLKGHEPAVNVPRAALEQGHRVLSQDIGPDGITRLLLRRGGAS